MRFGSDGSGWAGNERHERAMQFARILRLMVDAGLAAVIAEDGGSDLAAGVAVDAGGVDEEVAWGVFG
jgi:hypothetical protein